jgi:hypothetical protein
MDRVFFRVNLDSSGDARKIFCTAVRLDRENAGKSG